MPPTATPEPPEPGERRLARPPSERYRDAPAAPDEAPGGGTPGRAVVYGVAVALGVAVAIAVLGEVALVTAGLVAVAAIGGWLVALATRTGGGAALARPARTWLAIALGLLGVLGGQAGLWLIARAVGGVFDPLTYLGETFGILVPAQFLAAGVTAWLGSR